MPQISQNSKYIAVYPAILDFYPLFQMSAFCAFADIC
nr:MAG TPA: hypothetical protein [Caudoviricetes sp.]